MTVFVTLVRRELGGYLSSLSGYVVIATVLLLIGFGFYDLLDYLNTDAADRPLSELFFSTLYFWLVLLLATPVITMRTYALERSSGTYETLMTTQVSDLQVVLAKFTGSLIFYLVMWLPLLGCLVLVRYYTQDPSVLDPGITASTYLGILLLGGLYVALGCFASSLTRNQIIAAMISFAFGVGLFMLSFFTDDITLSDPWLSRTFTHISIREHMEDFARGVIDSRYVIFYLSLTAFFLFLNYRVVESRRWK